MHPRTHERLLDTQWCAAEILGIPEQLYSAEILGIHEHLLDAQLCAAETLGIPEQL